MLNAIKLVWWEGRNNLLGWNCVVKWLILITIFLNPLFWIAACFHRYEFGENIGSVLKNMKEATLNNEGNDNANQS